MQIIKYKNKYANDVKDLLYELQIHICSIDKEGYNIMDDEYREKYFSKTMDEVKSYEGKIFLAIDNDEVIGLIVGLINNEDMEEYDFKAPKRGRVSELVVKEECRSLGIGDKLLKHLEEYFKSVGCKDVLIEVFSYNYRALSFYEREGYHNRVVDMTKTL